MGREADLRGRMGICRPGLFNGINKNRNVFAWGDSLPPTPVANLADELFLTSGYYQNPQFHILKIIMTAL